MLLLLAIFAFPQAAASAEPSLDIFNSLEAFPVEPLSGKAGLVNLEALIDEERPEALAQYLNALKASRKQEEKNLLALAVAVLQRQMGQPERAIQTLDRDVVGNFILQDHLLDEKARSLMALAQSDYAENKFRSAASRAHQAIDLRFEVFRQYPDSPFGPLIAGELAWAERFLGDVYFLEGNYKAAWQTYRRALMREFDENEEHRMEVNLALADTYAAAGEYRDAADIYAFLEKRYDSPQVRERAAEFFRKYAGKLAELKQAVEAPEPTEAKEEAGEGEVKFAKPKVRKPHAMKNGPLSPSDEGLREFYQALAENDLPRVLDLGYQVLKRIPGNEETRHMMEPLNRQIIIYLRTRPWDRRVERIVELYTVGDLNSMGHRLWGSGLSTHAGNLFETILKRHPLEVEECHKALFFLGRIWEDKGNGPRALLYYKRLIQEYDFGPYTTDARFKVPWIERLEGRNAEAKQHFEELIEFQESSTFDKLRLAYPNADPYKTAARFWLGETEAALGGDEARANHQRVLVEESPLDFYGIYSHEALGLDLKAFLTREEGQTVAERKFGLGEVERKRLRRAESLIAAGLPGRARFELEEVDGQRGNPAFMFYVSRLLERAGAFQRAMSLSWSIARGKNLDRLSKDLAEGLFPPAYLDKVKSAATKHNLDPLFVISLIRQESAFEPSAVSSANAVGLMQLMPGTAAHVARSRLASAPTEEDLRNPATNIELGTDYLNSLLGAFGGNLVHALAAYNAGPRKVRSWLNIRKALGPLEFIESIPYNETRNYVKQILRNYAIYQALYKAGAARPIKDLLTKPGG